MKFSEIRDMSAVDLKKKAKAVREQMFEMKMKNTIGQLSNPLEIRLKRRELARFMTALSQKTVRS